jgi:hypothetical protein
VLRVFALWSEAECCVSSLYVMRWVCVLWGEPVHCRKKFLNFNVILYVVNGIWFKVLSIFCKVYGFYSGICVCCKVFLGLLELLYVLYGE